MLYVSAVGVSGIYRFWGNAMGFLREIVTRVTIGSFLSAFFSSACLADDVGALLNEAERNVFKEVAFIFNDGKPTLPFLYRWEGEQRVGIIFSEGSDPEINNFVHMEYLRLYAFLKSNDAIGEVDFSTSPKNLAILIVDEIFHDELKLHFNVLRGIFPENATDQYIYDYVDLQKANKRDCYSYESMVYGKSIVGAVIVISSRADIGEIRRCLHVEYARSLGLFGYTLSSDVDTIFTLEKRFEKLQGADLRFLKVLYGDAMHSGQSIDEVRAVLTER